MIEFLTNYWMAVIVLILVGFIIFYVVIATTKTEKSKKKWIEDIKVGDTCRVSNTSTNLLDECEIVEIDGKYVTVKVKIGKWLIYPPKK